MFSLLFQLNIQQPQPTMPQPQLTMPQPQSTTTTTTMTTVNTLITMVMMEDTTILMDTIRNNHKSQVKVNQKIPNRKILLFLCLLVWIHNYHLQKILQKTTKNNRKNHQNWDKRSTFQFYATTNIFLVYFVFKLMQTANKKTENFMKSLLFNYQFSTLFFVSLWHGLAWVSHDLPHSSRSLDVRILWSTHYTKTHSFVSFYVAVNKYGVVINIILFNRVLLLIIWWFVLLVFCVLFD